MGFILKIIITIAANSLAVYIASQYIPGFTFTGDWPMLAATGFLLAIGHSIVRPILKVLTFPLIIITFGLFNFVINVIIIWGVHMLVPELGIQGIIPLIEATLLFSITNAMLHLFRL